MTADQKEFKRDEEVYEWLRQISDVSWKLVADGNVELFVQLNRLITGNDSSEGDDMSSSPKLDKTALLGRGTSPRILAVIYHTDAFLEDMPENVPVEFLDDVKVIGKKLGEYIHNSAFGAVTVNMSDTSNTQYGELIELSSSLWDKIDSLPVKVLMNQTGPNWINLY